MALCVPVEHQPLYDQQSPWEQGSLVNRLVCVGMLALATVLLPLLPGLVAGLTASPPAA